MRMYKGTPRLRLYLAKVPKILSRVIASVIVSGSVWLFPGCAVIQYDLRTADALMAEGETMKALTHYQQLAKFGEPRAKLKLARAYRDIEDDEQALFWFREAAKDGLAEGRIGAARLLVSSDVNDVRNWTDAETMLMTAMDRGQSKAYATLIKLYRRKSKARREARSLRREGDSGSENGEKQPLIDDIWALSELSVQGKNSLEHYARAKVPSACYLWAQRELHDYLAQGVSAASASETDLKQLTRIIARYECALAKIPDAIEPLAFLINEYPLFGDFDTVFSLLERLFDQWEIPGHMQVTAVRTQPPLVDEDEDEDEDLIDADEDSVGEAVDDEGHGSDGDAVSTQLVVDRRLKARNRARRKLHKTIRRLSKGIESGDYPRWGAKSLERLYTFGISVDPSYELKLANLYLKNKQLGKSGTDVLAMLEQCAPAIRIRCQATKAQMFLLGQGVVQDPWRAEEILLSSDLENRRIQYLLGYLYNRGYLGEPHIYRAQQYLHAAASSGYKRADKELFYMYIKGKGLPRDQERAFVHLVLTGMSEEAFNNRVEKHGITPEQLEKIQARADVEALRRAK